MNKYLRQARFWQLNEHSILPFGKYLGKSVLQAFEEEPDYVAFCLRNIVKFTLNVTGWKALAQSNPTYFLQADNYDLFKTHLNKSAEVRRILRYNSHLDGGESKPVNYFRNKICFIIQDRFALVCALKYSVKQIPDEQGEVVGVAEFYFPLTLPDKKLSSDQENQISFSIKIIDYKDAVSFRKYESSYHQAGITVFEIFRSLPCGDVLLVLLMDWQNYRSEGSEGGENWIGLLPEDAACVLYLINSQLTVEEKVSAASVKQTNQLEQLIEWYSLNRKAFPNKNLFRSTNLQLHEHWLQFTLHSDKVDALTKQWYEATQNLKTYEDRHARTLRNRIAYWRWYWRSESDGRDDSDSDSERENWEELADGQDGTWEDWHEPND